ncbi:MAG: prefoldin subunit [Nanoarchaeota archaeon]|jgi:prefoldin beta subunit|nr:prefoldin subunit [Nanoarchaeota archaeon]
MDQAKLQQMQLLEQNLQSIYMQKQGFQMEASETIAALEEVEKTTEPVYKIIGQLMIRSDKEKTIDDLNNKKKLIETRLAAMNKQEASFAKELKVLRDELINSQKK